MQVFKCFYKNIKKNDIREIVWNQLSKAEQNEIIGTWKDGTIEKSIAKKDSNTFSLNDKSIDGKEVYLITFKSKNEPTIGNIQKLVDIKSNKIVGAAFRD
ncbi:hypothetical protein [Clostridium estertheticum]|uniref:hypothetical protein n=1 Tax=Clostridium estertheticum TaxID=238834 RepID=UPI001C7D2653|nr:hypothetical protein [Clostridium estertheticum]MBX4270042.1 hypothetical protein [Clostridium estertheticum]WLC80247.1 hypothetical protein KTC98_02630 [Clostridium estertheticum]